MQLQGGVISSDGVTAPVWFVNNILQKQFNQLSKEKSVDISEFNKAVQNMASGMINNTSHPVCAGCNVQFDGRSSPEFCTVCKSSYHKYKCYPSPLHKCYQKRRAQSHSSVPGASTGTASSVSAYTPASMSRLSNPEPHQSSAPDHNTQPQTCHANGATPVSTSCSDSTTTVSVRTPGSVEISTTTSTTQSIQASYTVTTLGCLSPPDRALRAAPLCPRDDPGVISYQIDSVPVQSVDPHVPCDAPLLPRLPPRHVQLPDDVPDSQDTGLHVNQGQGPSTGLNPNATLFVGRSESLRTTTSQSQKKSRPTKKSNTVSADADSIQKEFDKIQISTLQTKLQKLEVDNRDLKFRNSILMERNRILEEQKKNEIHQEHFPSQAQGTMPPQQHHHTTSTGPAHPAQPPCSYAPIIHNHYASLPCVRQCKCDPKDTAVAACNTNPGIDDLKLSVDELRTLVENLTVTLPCPSSPHPSPRHPSQPENIPAEPSQVISTPPLAGESSIITLDGFMFDEEGADMNLN